MQRIMDEGSCGAILDGDASLRHETRKWLYMITLPIMWGLTSWVMIKKRIIGGSVETNAYWFDGLSDQCRKIKEGAGGYKSLEIIYHFKARFGAERRWWNDLVAMYWVGMMNAQAVRNRLKIVTREVEAALRRFEGTNKGIKILSIAAGSARSVLEAMDGVKTVESNAVLVDISRNALSHSMEVAKELGVADRCMTRRGNIFGMDSVKEAERPDIVEMVGLLDYLDDKTIVALFKKIRGWLPEGGTFLTGHIRRNPEQYFLKWVINWEMCYRDAEDLHRLLSAAGFEDRKILLEPQGIHMVAVCRK